MEPKKRLGLSVPASYALNLGLTASALFVGNLVYSSDLLGRAQRSVIMLVGIYMILAVSLNVATGYLGQLPLGHAGFMAVGGYAGALFWKNSPPQLGEAATLAIGLLFAGCVAAAFGVAIGIPALRLRGDYLAIITLGFGEIIRVAIINLTWLTGGTPGLRNIPRHSTFLVVYICVAICCAVIHAVMKSRHGRAILSIRENEIAAEACGVSTTYYKVMAFTLSAFFAGVAGALFAGNQGILIPSNFDFMASINILVMVVLGGMGSMLGSMVAAAALTSLPLALQRFSEFRMVVYSLLLIIVMVFKPSGLLGTHDFSMRRIVGNVGTRALLRGAKRGGTKRHGTKGGGGL